MREAWAGLPIFGVVLLLAGGATANGEDEREALAARLAADRVRIRYLRNEEASILDGLRELEERIEKTDMRAAELEAEQKALNARVAEIGARLVENEAEVAKLRTAFGRRAAAMRRLSRARITRLLARAKRPSEGRRMRERIARVRAYDLNLVRRVLDAGATDRQLQAELMRKKARLKTARMSTEEEQEASRTLRAERAALLRAVQKERVSTQRLARELRSAARQLDSQFGRLLGERPAPEPRPGGFADQKGQLPWPVSGRLESAFGKKVDPQSKAVLVHKGIDIRTKFGKPVRAVFGGRVVFATHRQGYGRLLIIDHEGFHSLYAHLDGFQVGRGQVVRQHQVIGTVGDSGSTKGAYLYFEIRKGRDPVDPLKWLLR